MAVISMEDKERVEKLFLDRDIEGLFQLSVSEDFFVKHKSYYMLKKMKEQETVPFVLNALKERRDEEEILRLMDILAELGEDAREEEVLKALIPFYYEKNPYLVRGSVVTTAFIGGKEFFSTLVHFLSGSKGRIIRRNFGGELIGLMLYTEPYLEEYFEQLKEEDEVRGFFRDMEFIPKAYGLSVYPSNDYFALIGRDRGYDYNEFKYHLQSLKGKKF